MSELSHLSDEQLLEIFWKKASTNELARYRPYGHPDTYDDNWHLQQFGEVREWSGKPWQWDFHQMGKHAKQRLTMSANGVGKCCTINTHVSTPRGPVKIRDLRAGDRVWSMDNLGPVERRISAPFAKGAARMFRLFFDNGDWIEVTSDHRVFDGNSFLCVGTLLECVPCLPRSSSELYRLILLEDVLRCLQKRQGFRFDYPAYQRLRDEQLLQAQDTGLDDLPLRVGVLKRSPVSWLSDVLGGICRRIHRLIGDHPSSPGDESLSWTLASTEDRKPSFFSGSRLHSIQIVRQLQSELIAHLSEGEQFHRDQGLSFASLQSPLGGYNTIVAYQDIGEQTVWDFEVEISHNYIAGGVVNHNSVACSAETAIHATGRYPDWWDGCRFTGGIPIWVGSIDNKMQKIGPQTLLLGEDCGESLGTGFIPRECIKDITFRQAGVKDVVDTVVIAHESGTESKITFLTYEQGWRQWQSGAPKIIQLDEEPNENDMTQRGIFSEILTRLIRNSGILYCGYTPLLGETELTCHFMYSDSDSVWWVGSTWDDAPHLKQEDKELIKSQYKHHEIEARTQGVPMMGEGRIFDTPEDEFVIPPFDIPEHFATIIGVDFGIDHPAAVGRLEWDRDNDIVYLVRDWKKSGVTLGEHAQVMKDFGGVDFPVAWPHDGAKRDPDSGKEHEKLFRHRYGVSGMLMRSARYNEDRGGAQPQWPIIKTLQERLETGRFKVFSHCQLWLGEYRSYHTQEGKIVARHDDALKASFYALMDLRYARSTRKRQRPDQNQGPAISTRL